MGTTSYHQGTFDGYLMEMDNGYMYVAASQVLTSFKCLFFFQNSAIKFGSQQKRFPDKYFNDLSLFK